MNLYNESLANHTTFKVGGPVDILSIPESEQDLIASIKYCQRNNIPFRILGNGSNVLVNDNGLKGLVIKNTLACLQMKVKKNLVEVGSSVMVQKFIKFCVNNNLEGMEYLYSVPATIGGAVYMNAGRGKKYNQQISDKLVEVKIFNGKKIRILKRHECLFSYRSSIFHREKNWIILSATFRLMYRDRKSGEIKINERMRYVRELQDRQFPNAGSIFLNGHPLILNLLKGTKRRGAQFSKKTPNWIINTKNAEAKDISGLINYAMFLHLFVFKKPKLEIEIW